MIWEDLLVFGLNAVRSRAPQFEWDQRTRHGVPGDTQYCLTDRTNQNHWQKERSLSAYCIADIKLTHPPLLAFLKWLSTTSVGEPDSRLRKEEALQRWALERRFQMVKNHTDTQAKIALILHHF